MLYDYESIALCLNKCTSFNKLVISLLIQSTVLDNVFLSLHCGAQVNVVLEFPWKKTFGVGMFKLKQWQRT
jgi:hypothetical protein